VGAKRLGSRGRYVGGKPGPKPRAQNFTGSAEPAASFEADRLAEEWYDGQPRREGPAADEVISRFSPADVPEEVWVLVKDPVRECVEAVGPINDKRAQAFMNAVAQLFVWAHTLGQPLEPEVLLHPYAIDRFVFGGLAGLKEGTKSNYRALLRQMGRAVLGQALYPGPSLVVSRPDPRKPYSSEEVADLASWARGLPTTFMRRNALVLLAFGLGAGLTNQELNRLVGNDVAVDDSGAVVRLIGESERDVPVLASWEDAVAELAAEAGPLPVFRPDRTNIRRHDIPGFVDRCRRRGAVTLMPSRLRATWVVTLLRAGVLPNEVARVGGIAATQLARYFTLLPDSDPTVLRRQIRDAESR
jgi:integrase